MLDISIVIPLYRAVSYLPGLLASLVAQTFPAERFEVVLVDDASPDDTPTLAERLLAEQTGLNGFVVRRQTNGGVSATRNTGWQTAHAPLIVFIDQDCLADPALLASHWQMHAAQPEARLALAGKIVWSAKFQENPASEYYKATYFPSWDTYQPDGPNFHLFITSNASVSRAGLVAAGGFDEAFRHNYDDVSCGHRLERVGYQIRLCPAALVYHNRPLPIAEMFRRTRLAGCEMARFFQHYPELIGHWWLLNPTQAFNWADHLTSLPALLDVVQQQPNLFELFYTANDYILDNPSLHLSDPLFLHVWQARQRYQQDISLARWSEAAFKLQSNQKPDLSRRILATRKIFVPVRRSSRPDAGLPHSNYFRFGKTLICPRRPFYTDRVYDHEKIQISVLTRLGMQSTIELWQRFLAALSAQTIAPTEFELVVAVPTRLPFSLETQDLPFRVKVVSVIEEAEGWEAAGELAIGRLVILLSSDSMPSSTLLRTYQKAHRPGVVLVGTEWPLSKRSLGEGENLPDLTGFEPEAARSLHFSAYQLEKSCLERALFRRVMTGEFVGKQADLVTGWRLVEEQHARIQTCPTALNFASAPRRLAQILPEYGVQSPEIAKLYPALARQVAALDRPPPTNDQLQLLYEILKEYPFFLGLLEGLQTIFGITNLEELVNSPLFGSLVQQWETERATNLQAQLAALESGQAELNDYLRRF